MCQGDVFSDISKRPNTEKRVCVPSKRQLIDVDIIEKNDTARRW